MGSILVGIDGSDRGRRALDWAVRFARVVGYDVHMLAVIDEAIANKAGVSVETIIETAESASTPTMSPTETLAWMLMSG